MKEIVIGKIIRRIRQNPSHIFLLLLELLASLIVFPKFLYHRLFRHKFVAFDWADGLYEEFYLPISNLLHEKGVRVTYFWNVGYVNKFNYTKEQVKSLMITIDEEVKLEQFEEDLIPKEDN